MTDDKILQQNVLAELGWEPSISAAHIGVTARAGVVTLTGHVPTFAQKHAAEVAALRVHGVNAVAQEMEVRLAADSQRGDEEIAKAILERFAWNATLPANAIEVKVEKGWVTLTGHLEWWHQKVAADQDVRRLLGVVGLSNEIVIRPRVSAMDVSDAINRALNRSWLLEPNKIKVNIDGGHVRLSGSVHSAHDRRAAGNAAWSAAGAVAVENDLAIVA